MEGTAASSSLESGLTPMQVSAPLGVAKPANLSDNEEDNEVNGQSGDGESDNTDDENEKVKSKFAKGSRQPSSTCSSSSDESDHADDSASASASESDAGMGDNNSEPESGDESDSKQPALTVADGRVLSAYEIQRLERIRRNQEYLSRLGLERQSEGTARRRKRRKPKSTPVEKRESLRARKAVDYSEPSTTIASIVRDTIMSAEQVKPKHKSKDRQQEKKTEDRMERFVYREFQSIQTHKNQVLRQAEKDVKSAKRELKYWSKLADKEVFKERRREETQHSKIDEEKIRYGMTLKELLKEIDSRTSDLTDAVKAYDDEIHRKENEWEQHVANHQTENTLKLIEAIDRFPKVFSECESLLNALLLERSPRDRPPPRRSHRSHGEHEEKERMVEEKTNPAFVRAWTRDNWIGASHTLLIPSGDGDLTSRIPRNVGGWISPSFSAQLDRSWLDSDSRPTAFDPSLYVPQVGDCVLYYPIGHKYHLKYFPDTVGQAVGGDSRVPLWERGVLSEDTSFDAWSSQAWLSSIEDETCNYPILCRVENTCPEFPPDPYTKVIEPTNGDGGEQVSWHPPKDPLVLKRIPGTPLGLSVELRPLSQVLPPEATNVLSPPPVFSIVTFPTELDPFLLPFSWVYASHSLSEGDMAKHIDDEGGEPSIRIESFVPISKSGKRCVLEDYIDSVRDIVSRFDHASSQYRAMEDLLANAPKEFPFSDGKFAIEVMRHFLSSSVNHIPKSSSASAGTGDLFTMILRTLPLWNGASVVRNSNKRKVLSLSPWLLLPLGTQRLHSIATPDNLAHASAALEESLRTKIVFAIEDLTSRIDKASIFYYDITDDDAPTYGCAVPLMMSIEKVLRRLGKGKSGSGCMYRSVGAVVSDIGLIAGNCLLYNSPDSEVVSDAVDVVSALKSSILLTADVHFQERRDARMAEEDRYKLVCHLSNLQSDQEDDTDVASMLPPFTYTFRTPFKDPVEQDWLQRFTSTYCLSTRSPLPARSRQHWLPQAGDKVMYSRRRHEIFISAHSESLEPFQYELPTLDANDNAQRRPNYENENDSWVQGTIAWVRATFPRPFTKKHARDERTFSTATPLFAIGLYYETDDEIAVVYWRPCLVDTEGSIESSCPSCGLCAKLSYLYSRSPSTTTFPESDFSSLERCLSLLKRRCIRHEQIDYIDPNLTRTSVQSGYVPSPAKIGMKSLPTFGDLLGPENRGSTDNGTHVNTRGAASSRASDPALPALVESGYLPPWAGDESREKLELHKMISPWPKLSLELILLRLSHQFYRHKAAALNDVIEAYINQVVLLLSEAASRKKSPISLKRVARILSHPSPTLKRTDHDARSDEEQAWANRIRKIRDLHTMALVSVSEPRLIERLNGLSSTTVTSMKPTIDAARSTARSKIEALLSAVAKDNVQKPTNSLLMTRILIKCGAEQVSCAKYFAPVSYTLAELDGRATKIKVICGGKEFVAQTEALQSDDELDDGRETSVPNQLEHLLKCHVICNGARVKVTGSPSLPPVALLPGPLGDTKLKRVVEDSIRLSRKDCEESNSLVQFLVGQPGRMNPCARCQVYHRSFYHCRVVRGHVNADFDWGSAFADTRGIDGLLFSLNPNRELRSNLHSRDREVLESTLSHKGENDPSAKAGGCTSRDENIPQQQHPIDSDGASKTRSSALEQVKPREQLDKARQALSLANELLREAQHYSEAPTRLSRSFLYSHYPVDPSDGHFVYCIICGLSGNLLCCDGCANVVHQSCVALAHVPDGDWFCEECAIRKQHAAAGDEAAGTTDSSTKLENQLSLAFGRVTFNEEKALSLSKLLRDLNAARPEQKSSAVEGKDNPSSDMILEDAADSSTKPRRGRPRKVAIDDRDEVAPVESSSIPLKRGPGRPRKSETQDVQQAVPPKSRGRPRKVDVATSGRHDSNTGAASMPKRAAVRQHRDDHAESESDGVPPKKRRGNHDGAAVRSPLIGRERKKRVADIVSQSPSPDAAPPSRRRGIPSKKKSEAEFHAPSSPQRRQVKRPRVLIGGAEGGDDQRPLARRHTQSVKFDSDRTRERRRQWRRTKWSGAQLDEATGTTTDTTNRGARTLPKGTKPNAR